MQAGTTRPFKVCPGCGTGAELNALVCNTCGHIFQTQFSPETNTVNGTQIAATFLRGRPIYFSRMMSPPVEAPRSALIASMWLLTVIQFALRLAVRHAIPGVRLLLGLPSLCIAVALVCGRNRVDRTNGWIKIGVEVVTIIATIFLFFLRR